MSEIGENVSKSVKNKIKQGFSAFDLLTTILAVFIVGAITAPILFKSNQAHDLSIANSEVIELSEKITKQLLSDSGKNTQKGSREPASVRLHSANKWEGLAGQDPWGQSYNYKVLRDAYGLPTHIVVWSKGPNGVQDTPDSQLVLNGGEISLNLDDLGYVREMY